MTQRTHALATSLFLIVLGAGIIIAFYWLKGLGHTGRSYELVTQGSIDGLYVGARVTEYGLTVGHVTAIELRGYPPQVVMTIRVHRDIAVGAGTKAMINTALFGGGSTLSLLPPAHGPYRPLIGHPPRIPLVSPPGQLMTNLTNASARLVTLTNRLDRLLNPRTIHELMVLLRNGTRTSQHLEHLSKEASHSMPRLVRRLGRLLDTSRALTSSTQRELKTLTRRTQRIEDHLFLQTLPETDASLRGLDHASHALTRLLDLLDRDPQAWLYGRHLEATPTATVKHRPTTTRGSHP